MIEENKDNPRFLFSIVAPQTVGALFTQTILLTLTSNDFMIFFPNTILTVREKIAHNY